MSILKQEITKMNELAVIDQIKGDAYLLSAMVIEDERGRFIKDYSKEFFSECGIEFEPVERAILYNKANVLRGIHYQLKVPQPKMIHCVDGELWVVILDVRKNSRDYGTYHSYALSTGKALLISGNYAVGTLSMTDSILMIDYGSKFHGEYSTGIRWDDETINIPWPIERLAGDVIISERDRQLPRFSQI